MDVKLIVMAGKHAGQALPVVGPKFFIGRADDCQLRPSSDLVSRHHCAILIEDGFVAVRDLGSRNGTYVNGEPIRAEHELKGGDRLKVGPLEFEVRLAVDVGGKKKPKVHSVQEAAARTVESVKGEQEEMEISEWLGNGDDTSPSVRSSDTTPITLTGTTTTSTGQPAAAADEGPKKKEEKKKEEHKKEPAKTVAQFQRERKPASASSGDAAADVLRHLFGRR
jgi:pSer/pThr/pTyr-binding forkhead associated (FHA) protein